MTPLESALWDRILGFCFDHGGTALSFGARLAKDNGWELLYALRVLDEYRKFSFLLAAAGHMVVPSDAVDQAWHLHILFTKSWIAFCAGALRIPVRHEPSFGESDDGDRFKNGYAQTIETYRRYFGEAPRDIWPDARTRFGRDLHYQRVNLATHVVIPRFWQLRR
jgi:hypothetical protein